MTTDLSAAELAELRAEFPITEHCAYFQHASTERPPRRTLEAIWRRSAVVSASTAGGAARLQHRRRDRPHAVDGLASLLDRA